MLFDVISDIIKVLNCKISPFYFNHFDSLFLASCLVLVNMNEDSKRPFSIFSRKSSLSFASFRDERLAGSFKMFNSFSIAQLVLLFGQR
mgnify:CR=1 FL=1